MTSITHPDDSISSEEPGMHIVLFNLSKPRRINDEGVVWHPSDALRGHVTITAKAEIDFEDIHMFFEGDDRARDNHDHELGFSLTSAFLARNVAHLHNIYLWT